ncbi:MAG: holo-ACP synthase [Treponema sp.]|nr:holo-ACP synthase [Treponema sp.]
MIFGIGTDIVETKRFSKWVKDGEILKRYFAEEEQYPCDNNDVSHENRICQHYAVRFAAKEAFSKALGTGILGFDLKDIYVEKNTEGKPSLVLKNKALELLQKRCPDAKVFVSLSHEKEYATAFVVIEKVE